MNLTPSQFAWHCCQAGDFPPPTPKKGDRYGLDAVCCLCGGDTGMVGWPRKLGIADTFTDVSRMIQIASHTVCQACVATSKSEGWKQSVLAHPERNLPTHFPQKGDKPPRDWNWLYSHHLFIWPDHHECPHRERWRAILCDPPEALFLAVFGVSGKKQIIFKSTIAMTNSAFYLQMDDDRCFINPPQFAQALQDFDRLYALGFSKDGILTGQYHNKTLLDVGLTRWRDAEAPAVTWRTKQPMLWQLCHVLALRPEGWEPPARREYAPLQQNKPPEAPASPKPIQHSLF